MGFTASVGSNGISSALWVALICVLVLAFPCFIVSVG